MPYISQDDRTKFETIPETLYEEGIDTAGELQYLIAQAISVYMNSHPQRYQTMNDIMGALSGAQMEFYRRVVAPYEDKCIVKNGDVDGYPYNPQRS